MTTWLTTCGCNPRVLHRFWLTAVLLLVAAGLPAHTQPLPSAMGDITVTSSLRSEFRAAPGETLTGSLTVRNDGQQAAVVNIKQEDFLLDLVGQVQYQPQGSSPRSNRTWLTVPSQAQVPAGSSVTVPFTVRVPDDPELKGSYWSMIVVEPQEATTFQDDERGEDNVATAVTVSFRYGIAVLVHVGQPDEQVILFADPQFSGEEGNFRLGLTLQNPGEFLLSARTWLELYDQRGALVRRVEGGEARLYPEASLLQHFELGALEPQRYQAVVIADAGGEQVYGVRYTLPVEAGATN